MLLQKTSNFEKELHFVLHSRLETSSAAFTDIEDSCNSHLFQRWKSAFLVCNLSQCIATAAAEHIWELYREQVGAP